MRDMLVTLREFVWTVIALLAAGVLAAVVLAPRDVAVRAATVFDALEREGFDIKLRTPLGEATFTRVTTDIAENDATILQLRNQLATTESNLSAWKDALSDAIDQGADVDRPPQKVVVLGPEPWAVIARTATGIGSARRTVNALQRAGIDRAAVLQVGDDLFQAAVLYDDRAAADMALARVADVVGTRPGPYLRATNLICPGITDVDDDPTLKRCDG